MLSIFAPYSKESSITNDNSGVFLKFILFASSDLIKPDDLESPFKVSSVFFEFKILTQTLAYFKSGVTFTLVTLISPVTVGSFKS